MARKKKRMKLPNGFGCIKYLGTGRRNPYAVYPPVKEWTAKGPVTPKALGYKATWEEGYELLTTYNLEKQGRIKVSRGVYIDRSPTFSAVYEEFWKEKFVNSPKKLSEATQNSMRAAYRNCGALHDRQFGQLVYKDLQDVVNDCRLKSSSLELIITLLHQMYKYALKNDIVSKDYSVFLYNPKTDDNESGEPFSQKELEILWNHKGDPVCEMLLIMIYSGYRIKAFEKIKVDLTNHYFQGGVKTATSKNRIVPIHSGIYGLVSNRCSSNKYDGENLLFVSVNEFRLQMYNKLKTLKISHTEDGKKHTPHDCRHTFSYLCEKYKVHENDRKRLLGHSFGADITNAKYGHRTVEELREEIEKIQIPQI